MTRRPAASNRAAAATTSITMKGGTALRADGFTSRSVFSRGRALPISRRICRIGTMASVIAAIRDRSIDRAKASP